MGKRAPTYDELKDEYTSLLANAIISPKWEAEATRNAQCIVDARTQLHAVEGATGVPWWVVGVIQCMEAGIRKSATPGVWELDLSKHLHNGDSLQHQTHNVPAHRPPGAGPFTYLQSAIDAIQLDELDKVDWTTAGVEYLLYKLEGYNGWGVRWFHPKCLTAYLWSGTNQYKGGKYIRDGVWSDSATSGQIGAAPIIVKLKEMGVVPEPKLVLNAADGETDTAAPVSRWPVAEEARDESMTQADVVKDGSRSMGMFAWLKFKLGIGLGIDGLYQGAKFFSDGKDTLNDVATFIESHAGLFIGAFLLSCFVMACLGGWYLVEAARDGRYDPRKA